MTSMPSLNKYELDLIVESLEFLAAKFRAALKDNPPPKEDDDKRVVVNGVWHCPTCGHANLVEEAHCYDCASDEDEDEDDAAMLNGGKR